MIGNQYTYSIGTETEIGVSV